MAQTLSQFSVVFLSDRFGRKITLWVTWVILVGVSVQILFHVVRLCKVDLRRIVRYDSIRLARGQTAFWSRSGRCPGNFATVHQRVVANANQRIVHRSIHLVSMTPSSSRQFTNVQLVCLRSAPFRRCAPTIQQKASVRFQTGHLYSMGYARRTLLCLFGPSRVTL
jgi:hypothetical protein